MGVGHDIGYETVLVPPQFQQRKSLRNLIYENILFTLSKLVHTSFTMFKLLLFQWGTVTQILCQRLVPKCRNSAF